MVNPFAVAFFEVLHSCTEDVSNCGRQSIFSVVTIFDDEDVRDPFRRTDFNLMRTAAFTNQTLWDTLTERSVPRFDSACANCWETTKDVVWSSRPGTRAWRIQRATRVDTTAPDHPCESQSPRISVSIVAAHSEVVNSCNRSQSHDSGTCGARKSLGTCKRTTHMRNYHICLFQHRRSKQSSTPSLLDRPDATSNTQEMDTSASQGSVKRDGAGAQEQRSRRQLRRTASRTKQDGGTSDSAAAVSPKRTANRREEPPISY